MGGDQVSKTNVTPALLELKLVGGLVTREKLIHNYKVNMII